MTDIANPTARRALPLSYGNFIVIILILIALSDVLCWSAAAHFGVNKALASNIFVVICTSAIVAVIVLPWFNLRGQVGLDREQRMEKTAGAWVAVLALVHLTWELPWVLFHSYIMGTAGEGKLWSYMWWIYADGGDVRYIHPDDNLLALESGATLLGLTALVLVYLRRKAGRFTRGQLVVVASLMAIEFYSTIIYVLSESYSGMKDVSGAANLVVKFGYGNILWLTVPCIVFLWAKGQLSAPDNQYRPQGQSQTVDTRDTLHAPTNT
ncbi:hypothetical protein OG874_30425 [Nocardia sp. NBC_00565]|uniref:hypothetical protein n=1 Tax=Nocardia sp. NBC_00565 TaxID=2975993 RepID=UPI002E7FB826|nr:hypothetical protein [Nocardia sp. NBC_00565]WUC01115.1 hypothetical protein OG874_30425 [Nocardia sp. NBC_00565]